MAGQVNPVTGLDTTSERVARHLREEIAKRQLTDATFEMLPITQSDRNPKFRIATTKGVFEGEIAEETAGMETEEGLREIVIAHLLGALRPY